MTLPFWQGSPPRPALTLVIARTYDHKISGRYSGHGWILWYNRGMNSNDNFDCTSDLPDNFDPAWDEPVEQEWDDWRDDQAYDDSMWDAAVWESAYGPADDGGYSF